MADECPQVVEVPPVSQRKSACAIVSDTLYVNTDCWRYWQPDRVGVPWVMSFVLPYTVKSPVMLLPVVLIHHLRLLAGFPTSPLHVSLTDVYGLYVLLGCCGWTWMGLIDAGSATIKRNKHLKWYHSHVIMFFKYC